MEVAPSLTPALEQAAKKMRALLRRAAALRAAGGPGTAAPLYDQVVAETPEPLRAQRWYDSAVGHSSGFAAQIASVPRQRVFIAGCGRSGTWFALGIMATFAGVLPVYQERHFGHFAMLLERPEPVHVVKRNHDARYALLEIPEEISLLYMVRDPRDVLTSSHLTTTNYISIERWEEETHSLQALLASGRRNLHVIRFEDLAQDAAATQARLAAALGLTSTLAANRFNEVFQPDARTREIMNGLRPPDPSVIGRWRRDPAQVDFVSTLNDRIRRQFGALAERYRYDLG